MRKEKYLKFNLFFTRLVLQLVQISQIVHFFFSFFFLLDITGGASACPTRGHVYNF